ncbi:hypothetical protein TNCV_3755111 [Trichonephila clavipes]|nr:hypothetical protein TNCV_3755111 [Trichonephila clavipes]
MPNIIDSHDMGLRTVLQSRRPKINAYSTPISGARHNGRDSRFGRRVSMTSNSNWSEGTDSTIPPSTSTTGLGAILPSRVNTGDEYIAEKSDLIKEAICARNVYAA